MADKYFNKINKNQVFHKTKGFVEVWAVFNPSISNKFYLPILGTQPLNPCVIDSLSLRYCIFGDGVELVKRFDYIPTFIIDDANCYKTYFPFTKDFIFQNIKLAEKKRLIKKSQEFPNQEIQFFQTMQIIT